MDNLAKNEYEIAILKTTIKNATTVELTDDELIKALSGS